MATLSFDIEFSIDALDFDCPEGYILELNGDVGEPTSEEWECVMAHSAPVSLRLAKNHKLAAHPVELRGNSVELAVLKSNHYTWRIERSDGKPLMPTEVQVALLGYSMHRLQEERARESVISMPMSMLARLLNATDAQRRDLVELLADNSNGGQLVDIQDEEVAARLAMLDILAGTEVPGLYLLQNVEVK